jgi:hypothetical protein
MSSNEERGGGLKTIMASLSDITRLSEKFCDLVKEHHENHDAKKHNFDFMDVKNTLYLSYLIDLMYYIELKMSQNSDQEEELKNCVARLNEMRVVLDKIRPMEKKLGYQLQKLLTVAENLSSSVGNDDNLKADPLSFRPDTSALESSDDEGGSSVNDDKDGDSSDDEDLKAAKSAARAGNDVYRAPRIAAVPYDDHESRADKLAKMQQRQTSRMRNSEVMQTLRQQYSDRPDEDDIFGGAKPGTMRESARRIAAREAEKTAYEESAFMRLGTSKKERKEKNRMMREEVSNLNSIADVGGLVSGVAAFERSERYSKADSNHYDTNQSSSKRKRQSGGNSKPQNSLQALAFSMGGSGKKGKKGKKRR